MARGYGERVSLWGPYEIPPGLYRKLLSQKEFIESGAVGYQCIDTIGEAGLDGEREQLHPRHLGRGRACSPGRRIRCSSSATRPACTSCGNWSMRGAVPDVGDDPRLADPEVGSGPVPDRAPRVHATVVPRAVSHAT